MATDKPLINKVAASGLITIKLEEWWPSEEISSLDLRDFLFKGLILREQEFRSSLESFDWNQYQDKVVCVYCSSDAIIPVWAYMLMAKYLSARARLLYQGVPAEYVKVHYSRYIEQMDIEPYRDKRLVIKGCGEKDVPESAYLQITSRLLPVAKSIMYGEPCSTVPVYKRKSV